MAKEIERKFLVRDDSYKAMATGSKRISQCYLSEYPHPTVRVRRIGDKAFITIKGKNIGMLRDEWEYPIPERDAMEMADSLCGAWSIDKTRYIVPFAGHDWEVDEFHGAHEGLTLAEVELTSENEAVEIPPFAGEEVTGDPAYYNSTLASKKS